MILMASGLITARSINLNSLACRKVFVGSMYTNSYEQSMYSSTYLGPFRCAIYAALCSKLRVVLVQS